MPPDADEQPPRVNAFQSFHRNRPEVDAGFRIKESSDHNQFSLWRIDQGVDDWNRVGDDLQSPSRQLAGHLQGRGPTVENDRFARLHEGRRRVGNVFLLLAGLRSPHVKRRQGLPDVRRPASRPANLADSVKKFQIPSNGGITGTDQFRELCQ